MRASDEAAERDLIVAMPHWSTATRSNWCTGASIGCPTSTVTFSSCATSDTSMLKRRPTCLALIPTM